MKRGLRLLLSVILVNIMVFSFLLCSKEMLNAQRYEKLPDDIEHIKNDVTSHDLKKINKLEEAADLSIRNNGIKREVFLNRLNDKSILEEDDNELVLVYKVQYSMEEKPISRSPIVTGYRIDSEYYSYNNTTINLSVRIDYNKDLGYLDETGAQPVKITKSTYTFDAGSTYYNNRLGVDQIEIKAMQFGPPYPSGRFLAGDYSDINHYSAWVFSDCRVVNHRPSNYSLMKDDISGGYIFADGVFSVVNYVTAPPYNYWFIETVKRNASYGSPIPT